MSSSSERPSAGMTNQEVFNKVARHLRTQGKPARVGGACKYRTEDGLKCAAGCLILDEHYKPELEGKNIWGDVLHALLDSGVPRSAALLVQTLQNIHDWKPVETWPKHLRECAKMYGLSAEAVSG